MQTRSQTRNHEQYLSTLHKKKQNIGFAEHTIFYRDAYASIGSKYDVEIDFDEASKQWHKNKTRLGNGCYQYKSFKTVNHATNDVQKHPYNLRSRK